MDTISICFRLIWCPYLNTIEEDGEEEDTSCAYLLLLTHGQTVEIWDLNTVIDEHGTGPLRPEVKIFSLEFRLPIYVEYISAREVNIPTKIRYMIYS